MTTLTPMNPLHTDPAGADAEPRTVHLEGFDIHAVTEDEANQRILGALEGGRGGWVITVNLDILRRIASDASFRALAEQCTLRVADGMPLIWASRLRRDPLPERVTGSSMIFSLTQRAAERGRSVFLLGGNEGAARAAAEQLRRRFPKLRIAGTHCPPFGFEQSKKHSDDMRLALAAAEPDIVYVALGCPKQERLIAELRDLLPGAWWLGVGISFSFVAGDVRRAPRWLQAVGLEWFHRFAQEPRRLARRYFQQGAPYALGLFIRSWRAGRASGKEGSHGRSADS